MTVRTRGLVAGALLAGSILVACNSGDTPPTVTLGSPKLGKEAIPKYGCGSCHTIPGVRGANGQVGPPLEKFGLRKVIAGRLANSEENLVRWIKDPPAVEPGTAMPNLHVSDRDAQNIAAYLISQK